MPTFQTRIADGWRRALDHLPLAAVPVVLAAANVEKMRAILAFDGVHVGLRLGSPLSVVTVWQFVSVPNAGVSVSPGIPVETLPVAAVTAPVWLAVQAALAAGYFGSLRNALTGDAYAFLTCVERHFVPFALFTAVPALLLLPIALGAFGLGATTGGTGAVVLLVVLLPALLVAAYLFAATPYLVVLRDTGLIDAARASYALAVRGDPYLSYMVGFALFVLAVSPVATIVVVNVPVVGLVVGIVGGGVLGIASNVATMRFVADVDPATETPLDGE